MTIVEVVTDNGVARFEQESTSVSDMVLRLEPLPLRSGCFLLRLFAIRNGFRLALAMPPQSMDDLDAEIVALIREVIPTVRREKATRPLLVVSMSQNDLMMMNLAADTE